MDKVLNIIVYNVCWLQTSATCFSHVTVITAKHCPACGRSLWLTNYTQNLWVYCWDFVVSKCRVTMNICLSSNTHFQPHTHTHTQKTSLLSEPVHAPRNSQPLSHFVPTHLWRWYRQSFPKCWQLNSIRRRTSQKKTYDSQTTAKVWNKEWICTVTMKLIWPSV
jgi:hypothetical protein